MDRHHWALIALASIVLAACSGSAGAPSRPAAPPASAASGGAAPVGSGAPASPALIGAIEVKDLVASAAVNDGLPVRVSGFLVIDGTSARLCEVSLESYPPQCGGASVRLAGQVPRATLQRLSRTTDAQLAQQTWGWVIVTGTFQAAGLGGDPTIELGEILLAEG